VRSVRKEAIEMKTQIKIFNAELGVNIFGLENRVNEWMEANRDTVKVIDVRYIGDEKNGCIMVIYEV
jgi:hypothetical protein